MINLFITIIARIETRKGPAIPCELYFETRGGSIDELSPATSSFLVASALYEKAGGTADYLELGNLLHNDTGLMLSIAAIKVIEQPEEEE